MHDATDSQAFLACHEEILRLARLMRGAAQRSDWNALTDLQKQYVRHVDMLRQYSASQTLSASERAYRYDLLKAILSEDAAIRNLIAPEYERIGNLLNNTRRQQGLVNAYGYSNAAYR